MNKITAAKTQTLEPVKLKSKAITKRNLGPDVRAPFQATSSRLTVSKAKDMADLTKMVTWDKVTLGPRKTSGNFAKLNLVNATVFSAETNSILLSSTEGAFAEASVAYKALAAGDNFLVRFLIDVISDGSSFQLSTFGASSPQTMTLDSGPHDIPVVAEAQAAGDHSVQLLLKMPNRSFYLTAIEIQPLSE